MQCEMFEQRMHELLDRRLPPEGDSHLQSHATQCTDCRDLLVGQERLFEGLQLGLPLVIESRDWDGVAESIIVQLPARKSRQLWLGLGALAAAAVLLIAVTVAWPHLVPESPIPSRSVAVTEPVTRPGQSSSFTLENLRPLLNGLPDERFALAGVDHLAGGLRPLATTFSAAWDALRRTLPLGRDRALDDRQADHHPPHSHLLLSSDWA